MRRIIFVRLAIAICFSIATTACNRSTQTADNNLDRQYEAHGIIRGFAPDRRTIDVEHEDIRGFMPSMTMPFSVHDPKQTAGLVMGDAISFRLTVTEKDSWIDQVRKIDIGQVHLPTTPAPRLAANSSPRLRDGDVMPPFELTDQDGHKISLETFRGHPLVLTFIFTRCPIPNFCPLMSKNFAELQKAIANGSGPLAQTHLLSISFDPDFDTPQILKEYAAHAQAEPQIWTLATGAHAQIDALTSRFSVFVEPAKGTISHGLATALVGPDGNLIKIWRGNAWSASEVAGEIRQLSR